MTFLHDSLEKNMVQWNLATMRLDIMRNLIQHENLVCLCLILLFLCIKNLNSMRFDTMRTLIQCGYLPSRVSIFHSFLPFYNARSLKSPRHAYNGEKYAQKSQTPIIVMVNTETCLHVKLSVFKRTFLLRLLILHCKASIS